MRSSQLFVACLAVVAALGGCGTSSTSSTSSSPCSSDWASPTHQVVKVQPPTPAKTITASHHLACGTTVTVAQSGTTDLYFSGMKLNCELDRLNLPGSQPGILVSRVPTYAYFFRLRYGEVLCTIISTSAHGKVLCGGNRYGTIGNGIVMWQGQAQAKAACNFDPAFMVAVRAGSVRVIDPAGKHYMIRSGFQLSYNFSTHHSTVTPVVFSARDRAVFIAQARATGLPQFPQAITFISRPPLSAVAGGTYTVTVAASSGDPVALSIAAPSASVCSISSYTVTFNAAGLCVIDASQAGDAEYQAAPPARQEVKVG
jgi:hypothetical protein